jgi:hypothetical protein
MVKFIKTPFATAGDKTTIPDAADPSGFVSWEEGYPLDYSRPYDSDPLAKPIERLKLNQALYDISSGVQQYQTHGVPDFITAADNGGIPYPYPFGSIARYDDGSGFKIYRNTVAGNTNNPVSGGWVIHNGVNQDILTITPAADADYTLSASENEYGVIKINTGSFTTARNIIISNDKRKHTIINNSSYVLTVKTSAGTGIKIGPDSNIPIEVYTDGTNVIMSSNSSYTGSNSNGYFTKFADGTFIGWKTVTTGTGSPLTYGAIYVTDPIYSVSWTFPVAPVGTVDDFDVKGESFFVSGGAVCGTYLDTLTTTTLRARSFFATTSVTTASKIKLSIAGRWFQ